jgi:trigger factor
MHVEDVSQDGLRQVLKITLDEAQIAQNVAKRLAEIGKSVKVPGFRPGKVPQSYLSQRFGDEARMEAIEVAAKQAADDVLKARKLQLAMQPEISFNQDQDGKVNFNLTFDVLPEVTLKDFGAITIDKPVAKIGDDKITEMLQRIAKTSKPPVAVEPARPVKQGDVLRIDFVGTVDGHEQPGMRGTDHQLEIGSGQFIPGFEEQLIGTNLAQDVLVKVVFPADYHAASLANKAAEFKVTIRAIMEHPEAVVDEAMAEKSGFENLEEMTNYVRSMAQNTNDKLTANIMRRQLFDLLMQAYDFPLPKSMVQAEFNSIWEEAKEEQRQENDGAALSAADEADYRLLAERRIRLGLVLAQVAKTQTLEIKPEEMREALLREVRKYPGSEKKVYDYFTQTRGAMERLRAPLLEDKAVDYIYGQVKLNQRQVTIDELNEIANRQEREALAALKR